MKEERERNRRKEKKKREEGRKKGRRKDQKKEGKKERKKEGKVMTGKYLFSGFLWWLLFPALLSRQAVCGCVLSVHGQYKHINPFDKSKREINSALKWVIL